MSRQYQMHFGQVLLVILTCFFFYKCIMLLLTLILKNLSPFPVPNVSHVMYKLGWLIFRQILFNQNLSWVWTWHGGRTCWRCRQWHATPWLNGETVCGLDIKTTLCSLIDAWLCTITPRTGAYSEIRLRWCQTFFCKRPFLAVTITKVPIGESHVI